MDKILENLTATDVVTIFLGIISIGYGIYTAIKASKKAKETNEEFNFQAALFEEILFAMENSEKIISPLKGVIGTNVSEMKLDNALQRVQNYCLTNNKPFNREKVEKIITDLINFSKNVNNKKSV